MICETNYDLRVTRGDTLDLTVGLSSGWDDINAAPSLYECRLVIRQDQNDAYPDLLEKTADLTATTDSNFPDMAYAADLSLTPAETATIPEYQTVHFVEVRAKDLSYVKRLLEGDVRLKD